MGVKAYQTYEQQVAILADRGMDMSGTESAVAILRRVNYYRLRRVHRCRRWCRGVCQRAASTCWSLQTAPSTSVRPSLCSPVCNAPAPLGRPACRTARNYARLAARSDYQDVLAALSEYVRVCLPWPHQTEGRFWSVTSLPGSGRTAAWRRVAALSVNNVEALVLGEWRDPGPDWVPGGFVNIARTATPERSWGCDVQESQYTTVGAVWRCGFNHPNELIALLGRRDVAEAARAMAIGLLRKGEGLFACFHDYHLADDIFLALAGRLG